MKCLVVIAHPLPNSLCHVMARVSIDALSAAGHQVEIEDLYRNEYSPLLTASERNSYYDSAFDASVVQSQIGRLLSADALILVFPTWWFGFPAILKGWFDRVWAPGFAYDHANDLGRIKPRLKNLKKPLLLPRSDLLGGWIIWCCDGL